jgi:hypothetical protein
LTDILGKLTALIIRVKKKKNSLLYPEDGSYTFLENMGEQTDFIA